MNRMDEKRDDGADQRNAMAKKRTEEASRRTQLANERTFSAWVRTGLALLVTGFAATRLLEETGPAWLITMVGVVLVGLGALAFLAASRSYKKRREPGTPGLSDRLMSLFTTLLVLLSGIAVFLIINAR